MILYFIKIRRYIIEDILNKYYDKKSYPQQSKQVILPAITENQCRFCKKSSPEVTFKKIAHTISHFLENNTYKSSDECDTCNHIFSIYENNFAMSLRIDEFKKWIDGNRLRIRSTQYIDISEGGNTITFKPDISKGELFFKQTVANNNTKIAFTWSKDGVIPQNIYKILVKYTLSFLDKDILDQCSDTIKWIHNEKLLNYLPFIGIKRIDGNDLNFNIYIRKSNEETKDFPYIIGELEYLSNSYIFAIPETQQNEYGLSQDILGQKILSDNYNSRDFSSLIKVEKFGEIILTGPRQDPLDIGSESVTTISMKRDVQNTENIEIYVYLSNGHIFTQKVCDIVYLNKITG